MTASTASVNEIISPAEVASITQKIAVKKSSQDLVTLLGLAILGGAFVALGGLFASVVISGADGALPYGVTRLLMGLAFSLGLILVVIAGAQLFTSDALMVMAWASGKLPVARMTRTWLIVWLGNLIGALGTALLAFLASHYTLGHGLFGKTALMLATVKGGLPTEQAFFLGILCNVLVCLAAWLAMASRDVTGKILAIVFPITAFVAAGFEHCVANMFFIPYGLMIEYWAPDSFYQLEGIVRTNISVSHFLANLLSVSAGNWLGGALFVGGIYWTIFRERKAQAV